MARRTRRDAQQWMRNTLRDLSEQHPGRTEYRLELTQGKYARVDRKNAERVIKAGLWSAAQDGRGWYALHSGKGHLGQPIAISLHRFILNVTNREIIVDHIDGDGLHCTEDNMRLCTRAQNSQNIKKARRTLSPYLGVTWDKHRGAWSSRIQENHRNHFLGYHDDPEIAAEKYDLAAMKYHGEYATLNFSWVKIDEVWRRIGEGRE